MNRPLNSKYGAKAFSLIEIVLALGIVSFALVGIMGLFPVALKSAQESQRETRATLIAKQVFSDLASMPPSNTFIATNSNVLSGRKAINLAQDSTTIVNYDVDGLPIASASNAILQATITITTNNAPPGLTQVRTSIKPLNTSSSPYAPYVFGTLMDN